jgi:hypothetical protein
VRGGWRGIVLGREGEGVQGLLLQDKGGRLGGRRWKGQGVYQV